MDGAKKVKFILCSASDPSSSCCNTGYLTPPPDYNYFERGITDTFTGTGEGGLGPCDGFVLRGGFGSVQLIHSSSDEWTPSWVEIQATTGEIYHCPLGMEVQGITMDLVCNET